IQADPATNSLIISAPEPVYRELRAVIDKLDQRRAQVFIESLIAEVDMNRAAEFGVQWQAFGRSGNNVGVIGTNYSTGRASGSGSTTNIFDIAVAALGYNRTGNLEALAGARPSTGFNLGIATQALGVLAQFLQSTGTGNVLSTPTLLTLDNEEAKIVVGQNVPFVTGSFTNTGAAGGATLNPFQTYERQDVGLTLRVRPQISEDGTVKMVIYQESSNLVSTTDAGPITRKRAIESSVLVDDGAIVVLGGLLEDTFGTREDKVPLLGDIPVVGNLFKSQNRSLTKSNLMVFLRPVIVRDAAATENYSLDRYDLMRAAQQGNQPRPNLMLNNVSEAPVMPPVVPANPDAWTRPAPPPPLIRPAAGESNYYSTPLHQN
ncbi:MAG: secretin N-terminal domain-containing protein, partial [Pseudomonadota bacterium]|nr:secretin N-terminal domain-containing protein [Pseudomonadota bacterium]